MRVLYVVAAALALLQGLTCLLGAIGLGATADRADPMSTDEALGVAATIFVVGVVLVVGATLVLSGRSAATLAAGAGVSLAVSGYVALRWSARSGGYQIPLLYAVLPAAVLGLLLAGSLLVTGVRR